jgi:hypothetical protein
MRFRVLAGLGLMFATTAGAASAATEHRPPRWSWGKAGVSLDTYRADSIACARQAVYHDISNSDPAKAFKLATRLTDDETDPLARQRTKQMIGVERQFAKVKELQYATLERCLSGLGYRPFRLTDAQRKRLEELKPGSDARRAYLHSLAADPEVLAAQGE